MNGIGASLSSAVDRPVPLRVRPDLVFRSQPCAEETFWVAHDPITASYYHLRPEERAILGWLDGRTSLAEIRRRFEAEFAPRCISPEHIWAFLSKMHRLGLVLSEASGQGDELIRRLAARRWRRWANAAASVLAIRFRGVDPSRFLDWAYPKCRWLFSWWALAAAAALVASAILAALVNADRLAERLPRIEQYLTPTNAVWLAVALAMLKILHELGHAMTARHFGSRCHELGLMFLVFVPCLYCNVTDAWLLPSRWQRIAVSAAGVAVELVLAAACAWLWWASEPGAFQSLCLGVALVGSVNTVLFNGNPLLRYDGYYVLSDWLGIPNLAAQSRALLMQKLAWWCLGMELPPDRMLVSRRRGTLLAYGIASGVYRLAVVFAILWFCYHILKPVRLESLAVVLAGVVLAGMAFSPLWSLFMLFKDPARRRSIRSGRAAVAFLVLAVAITAMIFVPLPRSVVTPAVVQPRKAVAVYVQSPGIVTEQIEIGATVREGDPILRLVDRDLEKEILKLTGQRDQQRIQLENLRLRLTDDPSVGPDIPPTERALAELEKQLAERQKERERLVLRAPIAGRVLAAPRRPEPGYSHGRLRNWSGTPLDKENLGATLETGTVVCYVGDPARLEVRAPIDQGDVPLVRPGQSVFVQVPGFPGLMLQGAVAEVARSEIESASRELAAGKEIPLKMDREGLARPVEVLYEARADLEPCDEAVFFGARGRVKVAVDSQSLGQRAWRGIARTFHFAL